MGERARLFGVSRWTIYHRVQTYEPRFSTLSERYQLDEIIKEYLSHQWSDKWADLLGRLFEITGYKNTEAVGAWKLGQSRPRKHCLEMQWGIFVFQRQYCTHSFPSTNQRCKTCFLCYIILEKTAFYKYLTLSHIHCRGVAKRVAVPLFLFYFNITLTGTSQSVY